MPIKGPRSYDEVTTEIKRDDRNKLKVLASLEAMTMPEYLSWMLDKAYQASIHNKGRKVVTKK